MPRSWAAAVVTLFAVLLLTGCANLRLGTSPPAADPGNTKCVGGSGPTVAAAAPSGGAIGIVVHGSCTVIGAPDTATAMVAVQMQAVTARAALDAAGAKADAVITGVKAKGVNPQDVRAGEIQVTPVFSPIISSITGVGGTRVTGFVASRGITATLRDIATSAPVIQAITDSAGDSGIVQVTYSISNDATLRAQARAAAVRQAQDTAKQISDAAGVALGQLVSITDVPQRPPVVPPSSSQSTGSSQTTGTAQTSQTLSSGVAGGNDGQEVEAAVDVVYAVS
jgi:hypothetical protein